MKNNVILIKLKHSFLDVVAYVDDDAKKAILELDQDGTIELESPIIWQMVNMEGQARPMPQNFSFFVKDDAEDLTVRIRLNDILFGSEVDSELEREYKKRMSNIEQASVSDISKINGSKGS